MNENERRAFHELEEALKEGVELRARLDVATARAMREGAAGALRQVLVSREPDLAWEVSIPLDGDGSEALAPLGESEKPPGSVRDELDPP